MNKFLRKKNCTVKKQNTQKKCKSGHWTRMNSFILILKILNEEYCRYDDLLDGKGKRLI